MSGTPETFTPRPYQLEAIHALTNGWDTTSRNRLAVVLPTGAGKTVVFANLVSARLTHTRGRTLVLAHREELIEQAAQKIRAVTPHLNVGIVKAERDEHQDANVIVASVQTLAVQRRREAIRDIGMIIVDECHHAAAPTYRTVLDHYGSWSGLPTAGFTATMTRGDGGLGDIWQEVVYSVDILNMISNGYLTDVRMKRITVDGFDLDSVKVRAGDLQEGQIAKALEEADAYSVIADAYKELAPDRPGVVFTPTVDTAHRMASAFTKAGIPAKSVWGDMSRDERTTVLAEYQRGDLQVLTNCMVLTEGFDAPHTSCVVIARPTKSPGLYIQMAGRGLRLSPETGKKDALILDVMGASTRHKLASIVDLTGQDVGDEADEDKPLSEIAREAEEKARRVLDKKAIEWEDVTDVFGTSTMRWLRADNGTWFVPVADDAFLFLLREPDNTYRLRRWTRAHGAEAPQNDQAYVLKEAMRAADRHARVLAQHLKASYLATRTASWRTKPASEKSLNFCWRIGLIPPTGATAGDVSDLITIHRVSRTLRRALPTLELTV